jgi:hypothetical protein
MSAETQNLAAIKAAVDQHARNCGAPPTEIRMAPYEVERLGWDDFMGIPIKADPELDSGRFHVICEGDHSKGSTVPVEVETPLEVETREPVMV